MKNTLSGCEMPLTNEETVRYIDKVVQDAIEEIKDSRQETIKKIIHQELSKVLDEKLHDVVKMGARSALEELGLSQKDVFELGNLLKNWRTFKTEAGKSLVSWITKFLITALVIGLSLKTGIVNVGLPK